MRISIRTIERTKIRRDNFLSNTADKRVDKLAKNQREYITAVTAEVITQNTAQLHRYSEKKIFKHQKHSLLPSVHLLFGVSSVSSSNLVVRWIFEALAAH